MLTQQLIDLFNSKEICNNSDLHMQNLGLNKIHIQIIQKYLDVRVLFYKNENHLSTSILLEHNNSYAFFEAFKSISFFQVFSIAYNFLKAYQKTIYNESGFYKLYTEIKKEYGHLKEFKNAYL